MKIIKKMYLLIIILFPFYVNALELPELYSDKVLIYDLTDSKILMQKNSNERANIASLTKIITTITAISKIDDLNKEVIISNDMLRNIPSDASVAGLKVGDKLTVKDLLYASILPSGADATQALAVTASGSVKNFVEEMNLLVKKIGAGDTHLVNVTGLDADGHYSSAQDVLKILKYSLENPIFKEIYCTKEYKMSNGKVVKTTLNTYNRLMGLDVSRIKGSKTGYTSKSGLCIAALVSSNNHDILIITLKAPYVYGNFYNLRDALKLINFIDDNYDYQVLVTEETKVKTLNVELSKIDYYDIYASKSISKYLPDDYDKEKITIKYIGKNELSFWDKKDTKIGEVEYYYDGELLDKESVFLNQKIKCDFSKVIKKYRIIIIIGVLIIIMALIKNNKSVKRRK